MKNFSLVCKTGNSCLGLCKFNFEHKLRRPVSSPNQSRASHPGQVPGQAATMKNFVGSLISCLLAQSGFAIAGSNDPSMALTLVNQARQGKGLQPLSWDANLEAYAQFWANQMGSGMQPFEHSPVSYRPSQGENLYEQSAGQCDADYDSPIVAAMRAWLSQERLYTGQPITTGKEPWLHWCKYRFSFRTSDFVREQADFLSSPVYVVFHHPDWLCSSLQHL